MPLLSAGGDVQGFQVGSVFKIFTIVAALEQGLPLTTAIDTVSPYKSKYPVAWNSPAEVPRRSVLLPGELGQDADGPRVTCGPVSAPR